MVSLVSAITIIIQESVHIMVMWSVLSDIKFIEMHHSLISYCHHIVFLVI